MLHGHDGHDCLDEKGNVVYEKIAERLFPNSPHNPQYRRNSKYCISVPCFSKQVYAISFYAYSYGGESLISNARYVTKGMGFDLMTSNGVVEGFRIDMEIPYNTRDSSWANLPLWDSPNARKKGEKMRNNFSNLIKGLESNLDHLNKFYNIVYAK